MVDRSKKYGAVELSFTNRFYFAWNDKKSKAKRDVAIWHAKIGGTFDPNRRRIGQLVITDYDNPDTRFNQLVAKDAVSGAEMFKLPVDYQWLWNDKGSGATNYGSIWRPIPPAGYVALSDVFTAGWEKPARDAIWCVRRSYNGRAYVREGDVGETDLWNDRGSGADRDCSLWPIVPPAGIGDDDERLLVPVGGFTFVGHYDRPVTSPVCWVLDVPAEVKKAAGPPIPVMNGYTKPEDTQKVIDRQLTVPHTMIRDPKREPAWQFEHSPFYTVRRKHNFTLAHHLHNTSDKDQSWGRKITTGVSKATSDAFYINTSISVTTEGGIKLGPIGGKSRVNVTVETGYSTRTDVAYLKLETDEHKLVVPPHKAGALWFAHHELESIRADNTMVPSDVAMSFDINSTVVTQYPKDGPQVTHFVAVNDSADEVADRMARTAPPPDYPAESRAQAEPDASAREVKPGNGVGD
ncbi:Vps62-related protein [Streptomyces sp. NPDC003077]|uniref:Vps62-related protein n=1 Tax=Streptomyces sp. NPDC003077 TaxID=3154443 RepID=UPI0033B949B1